MRRILIESIRRKQSLKRGGHLRRSDLDVADLVSTQRSMQILDLDAALSELQSIDPHCARLVELRFFSGLTNVQAAEVIDVSPRTAKRLWAYAKAWLRDAMGAETHVQKAGSELPEKLGPICGRISDVLLEADRCDIGLNLRLYAGSRR